MNQLSNRKLRKSGLFVSSAEFMDKLGFDELYEHHRKQVKIMEQNKLVAHQDSFLKGSAIGLLSYAGLKYGVDEAIVAVSIPVVAMALSWASTKFGDKNVASFLKVAQQVIEAAPAKSVKKAAKKAPAKKAK